MYEIIVFILIGIDQIIKYWVLNYLRPVESIPVINNIFNLTYVENRGAAFGMMQGKVGLFVIITAAVLIMILWYWRYIPQGKIGIWMKVALVLVMSGAIGNFIDRVFLNYVRDMIYFSFIDFPVFNVADICVVVGVALLFPILLFGNIDEKEKNE